ncbi:hypothetical protein WME75_16690 [Sorangium sp. So ce1014]|uniref:DUF1819 domain-containing protein n=1 Tax=Sorangium sp. So ce1014 TaxID=3133326 RepID=UPI003F5DABCC
MNAASVEIPAPTGTAPRSSMPDPTPGGGRPAEATEVHTRLLRCMLAVDDCYAYWQHAGEAPPAGANRGAAPAGPSAADRARVAFERRWFGTKSEARVRTVMTDMIERFDAYPEALALLHRLGTVPSSLRPFVCHVHTQLADPIYRRFTGELLPTRREQGLTTIDRDTVARWVDGLQAGRWGASTCIKFASNLLATALDVGLVSGRRDPRKLPQVPVPDPILGYALYLLRDVRIEGSLTDNPYLRSLGVTRTAFHSFAARIPGIRFAELGGVIDLAWLEPSLTAWGLRYLGASA